MVTPALDGAINVWAPEWANKRALLFALSPLTSVTFMAVMLLGIVAFVALILYGRLRRSFAGVGTWDCGYAAPSAKMQYTASSFAETLVNMFSFALRPERHVPKLHATFPRSEGFHSHGPDTVLDRIVLPSSRTLGRAFLRLRFIQRGNVQAYLFYILVTLMLLFVWSRWL
jgi:hypothetical protein